MAFMIRDGYTERVECACVHCAEFASRHGLSVPLVAYVRPETVQATGRGKQARHGIVSTVHHPFFAESAARMESARGIPPLGVALTGGE